MSRLHGALAGSRARWRLESLARLALAHARARGGEVALAYDLGLSPPTFGDFALFCLAARLLQTGGAHTRLVVLDERQRHDTTPETAARNLQYPEIATALCLPGRWELRRGGRSELEGVPLATPRRDLRLAKPTYVWSWPLLEHAMSVYPPAARERFLLRAPEVAASLNLELPDRPYVALHVRAASAYNLNRDLSRPECERLAGMIREALPDHDLLVVSDAKGTETVRPWFGDALFAQDLAEGFAHHMALILGGWCYVQMRGGGVGTGAIWSRTPWFVASEQTFSPRFRDLRDGARIHPRWAPAASVWCADDEAAWDSLREFLAAIAAADRLA